jgi:hypothetical protein
MAAHKKPEIKYPYGYRSRESIQLKAKQRAEREGYKLSERIEMFLEEYGKKEKLIEKK